MNPATSRQPLAATMLNGLGVLLVVILLARCLAQETLVSEPADQLLKMLFGPTPQRSLMVDLALSVICAAIFALGHYVGVRIVGTRWMTVAMGLLAVGVGISCVAASNRRWAIDAGLDFVVLPLAAMALAVSLQSEFSRRLAFAGLIATVVVFSARCILMEYVEIPETREMYQADKTEIWKNKGVPLDSIDVKLFESRLYGAGVGGYYPSFPNAAGGLLAAGLVLVLGIGGPYLRRLSQKDEKTETAENADNAVLRTAAKDEGDEVFIPTKGQKWLAVFTAFALSALVLWAIKLTDSRAALVLAGVVLCFGGVLWGFSKLQQAFPRYQIYIGLAGLVLLFSPLIVGARYMRHHIQQIESGQIKTDRSLLFRAQYWGGTLKAMEEGVSRLGWPVWATGIGRENFAPYYLRFKWVESPEDVKSPHNLIYQTWVEMGLAGLVGAGLFWIGVFSFSVPPYKRNEKQEKRWNQTKEAFLRFFHLRRGIETSPDREGGGVALATACRAASPGGPLDLPIWLSLCLLVAAGVWGLQLWLTGFPEENTWAWVVFYCVFPGLMWCGLLVWVLAVIQHKKEQDWSGVFGWAIVLILMSNMIDFGLFLPGQASFAMLCVGLGLATQTAERGIATRARFKPATGSLTILAGLSALIAIGVVIFSGLGHVSAWERVRSDRELLQTKPLQEVMALWERPYPDPYDPLPDRQRADMLLRLPPSMSSQERRTVLDVVGRLVNRAEQLDPVDVAPLFLKRQRQAELLNSRTLNPQETVDTLSAYIRTTAEISKRMPCTWPVLLQMAEETRAMASSSWLNNLSDLGNDELRDRLERLGKISEVLAAWALDVDNWLRKTDETVQIMNPAQQERANALRGSVATRPETERQP